MAVAEWRKPLEIMEAEVVAALARLASGEAGAMPLREMAALVVVTAHQIPELVEAGIFPPGDLDEAAMRAMAVVVDIAAAWDDEAESLADFLGGIEADELARLAEAAPVWAGAVWEGMVPLDAVGKARALGATRRA